MAPETLTKKVSQGEAKHIRREKAAERGNDANELNRKIGERLAITDRLTEIGWLLSPANEAWATLSPQVKSQEMTMLAFEEFWLQAKIGIIKPEERQFVYLHKLRNLQERLPDTYAWFISAVDGELSRAEKLHESILPQPVLRK
jgi:hypothetical protein